MAPARTATAATEKRTAARLNHGGIRRPAPAPAASGGICYARAVAASKALNVVAVAGRRWQPASAAIAADSPGAACTVPTAATAAPRGSGGVLAAPPAAATVSGQQKPKGGVAANATVAARATSRRARASRTACANRHRDRCRQIGRAEDALDHAAAAPTTAPFGNGHRCQGRPATSTTASAPDADQDGSRGEARRLVPCAIGAENLDVCRTGGTVDRPPQASRIDQPRLGGQGHGVDVDDRRAVRMLHRDLIGRRCLVIPDRTVLQAALRARAGTVHDLRRGRGRDRGVAPPGGHRRAAEVGIGRLHTDIASVRGDQPYPVCGGCKKDHQSASLLAWWRRVIMRWSRRA